ncbi:Sushi, nidogen and EGF-like domain-containing protein 1 [Trichinella pseudospiralis]|uniref:Sushi, nidogen and EGF-like domain-containing protein 1 n=2 Tax=Trichinella pseudospiralis TaxID=6337 RepID=A0A0V1DW64_TRIPS|nr:Sushi, nidogen and EGF-like domain-containing protein 1 [Trichinella pseudospiralis]KRZ13374.1 Sushi, nidogen and EGF-like domain-containing protein 1 [Trichinella pseudospiralis]KRZ42927.1 Sushi, nidogen and EGF-like domain-containing protein 1 [Trichinella pseudospiralis]
MAGLFEIVLLTLIFNFDHRFFVAEGIICPEFRIPKNLDIFYIDERPAETYCLSEVPHDFIIKPTFYRIDNFERSCNYYYRGHLHWRRNRFVDGYRHLRQNVSWYNQGYAIRKWDLAGREDIATGISEGILRVDRLYRRNNYPKNDSTLIYEDIVRSNLKTTDFKVQLCSYIFNSNVTLNDEPYDGETRILWEPCTQRNSSVFFCKMNPLSKDRFTTASPADCIDRYTGAYCLLDTTNCEHLGCSQQGHCYVGIEGSRCLCYPGYTGSKCENRIDFCEGVTCNNRGHCEVKNSISICVCTDKNYFGPFCERHVPIVNEDVVLTEPTDAFSFSHVLE